VHVIDTGSGVPLVLLHAFPFDSRMWDRARAGVAEHARLITPDQRGFGRSPLSSNGRPPEPDLDVVAADVLALLDRLELARAVLGGCSMGGYAAMAVLRAAPERVAGLLLVDTKASADPEPARENRYAMADRAEREGTGWLADTMLPIVLGTTSQERRPDVVDSVRRQVGEQDPVAVAWAQRAMAARPDSAGLLREAAVPVLVICGEEDTLIPVEAARSMTELLANGELVVLPECGHLPPLEVPAEFTSAVTGWLAAR
jgi:pimeloyl-ACP methyl ester carboxylesterase